MTHRASTSTHEDSETPAGIRPDHDKPELAAIYDRVEALRVLRPGGRTAVNSADAKRPHWANLLLRQVFDELGLRGNSAGSGGQNHRVDGEQLAELLTRAGFNDIEVTPQTFVDQLKDVDETIAWSRSSSFGNWLSDLGPSARARVRQRLAELPEPLRTAGVMALRRHLVFAVARRP